jgi:APA family basic amino acid/polyamine antiporter
MRDLPATTFRVFFIWMVAAVATYFLYGMRHSNLNRGKAAQSAPEVA